MNRSSLRRWGAVMVAVACLAPLGAIASPSRDRAGTPAYDPSSVIVKYRPGAAKSALAREEVRLAARATVKRTFASLPEVESLALEPGTEVETAVAALLADPRVEYAEPNYIISTFGMPNDPAFHHQWGLHNVGQPVKSLPSQGAGIDVDAPEAWDMGTGSHDVVVAIVDEGLDVTHPDLAANVWVNPGEIPNNRYDDDGNGLADDVNGWDFLNDDATVFDGANDQSNSIDFHGTHTGGTVGAVGNNGIGVTGVCWNVRLMSLKFLAGSGRTDDAVACIDYAVAMKQKGVNLRAINASWGGGGDSQTLYDAIAGAGAAGILFCAAAGNGGDDGRADNIDESPTYPASYTLPNIITVGAWTRYNQSATFSNYGAVSVDLLAPGGLIASTGPNGGYFWSSGTSMAAPHVTGAVALMASVNPALSAAQIKELILSTVTEIQYLPPTVTGGRLSLRDAVAAALGRDGNPGDPGGGDPGEPPPPPPPPVPIPQVFGVTYDKKRKTLFVDGREMTGVTVIEINGEAMPKMVYSPKDQLSDGTYVRLGGKAPGLKRLLPKSTPVLITVYDTETGVRSQPFSYAR